MTEAIHESVASDGEVVIDYARRYIDAMREQRFSQSSIARHRRCLRVLCRLLLEERIGSYDLDEKTAQLMVSRVAGLNRVHVSPEFIAKRFVSFLVEQGLSKPPVVARTDDALGYGSIMKRICDKNAV
jgi:hypothetical protein